MKKMKKKILLFVAIAVFAVSGVISITSANRAQADGGCPNGCLIVYGDGCFCYEWYYNVKEGPAEPE